MSRYKDLSLGEHKRASLRQNKRVVGRARWFLRRMLTSSAPSEWDILGVPFHIHRGVFSPAFSKATELFAKHIVSRCSGKRVLEVGCGCGAISVLCALKGAKHVYCTDINREAIECTKRNIIRHGVGKRVVALHARGFDAIRLKFDVIFFGLPYVYASDISLYRKEFGALAYSCFDEKYASQRAFMRGVWKYTKPRAEILVAFSVVGDLKRFNSNVREFGLEAKLKVKEPEGRADNRLYALKRVADGE